MGKRFRYLANAAIMACMALTLVFLACGGGKSVGVTGVTVSPTTMTLPVGETRTLTAMVLPANATNKAVTWNTSDSAKATVSANGAVTAVAEGTATITVETVDGEKTDSCTVTITPAVIPVISVESVSLNKTAMLIEAGKAEQLTATVLPANATNKNITWSGGNAFATVSQTGLVTAVAPGSATITVTSEDNDKTASCAVTVTGVASGPNVYVAGTIHDGVSSNLSYLWTNNAPQKLNVTGNESDANSVFVSDDGTIYVAGYEYTESGNTIPTLYVNGTATELVTPQGYMYPYVYSVFVADNVAYAVGYIRGFSPYGNYAMLWEGDTPKVIGTQEGRAFSVYVDEGKVYVAGYEGNYGNETATLWVNDAPDYLQASAGCRANANSVFASGGNVYVAGYEWDQSYNDYATLWINGVLHRLPASSTDVSANSVYVSGGKAYVAGYNYDSVKYANVARIWEIILTSDGKGIQDTNVHNLTDGTITAKANSVFVVGGDIYAAGYEAPGWDFRATVWKVSDQVVTSTRLSENESEAKGVFVK